MDGADHERKLDDDGLLALNGVYKSLVNDPGGWLLTNEGIAVGGETVGGNCEGTWGGCKGGLGATSTPSDTLLMRRPGVNEY